MNEPVMESITLALPEELVDLARLIAKEEKRTVEQTLSNFFVQAYKGFLQMSLQQQEQQRQSLKALLPKNPKHWN